MFRRSRIIALEDDSVTHFNFRKGRSPKWGLNVILRRRAGFELAGDFELMSAWVQSKREPMDEFSRRWQLK